MGAASIREALLRMAEGRGDATFCPSEIARELADDWRPLMPEIREVAADLIDEKRLICQQKGRRVDIRTARGPIRLKGT